MTYVFQATSHPFWAARHLGSLSLEEQVQHKLARMSLPSRSVTKGKRFWIANPHGFFLQASVCPCSCWTYSLNMWLAAGHSMTCNLQHCVVTIPNSLLAPRPLPTGYVNNVNGDAVYQWIFWSEYDTCAGSGWPPEGQSVFSSMARHGS